MTDGKSSSSVVRKKNGFFGFPNNFIEDALDVPATTRNWSTMTKIVELVGRESEWPRRGGN